MKNLLIGFTFAILSIAAYKLIDNLLITLTARDEIEPPTDYFKEVKN